MASENASLAGTLLAGAYITWSVVERIAVRVTDQYLTPYAAYCPLWAAIIAIPVFLFLRNKHHYLHGMRIHGCKPAPVYPHSDPIFGLDMVLRVAQAIKDHEVLELWDSFFRTIGNTYWSLAMGRWIVVTAEPENLKAILFSQFDSWDVLDVRQQISIQSLGPHAIFSVNGKEWQHARSMIRPSFVRNQIADLECTDRHVENFLKRLPTDGSKVNIENLLYLFTIDITTDFMFGYSTDMLCNPTLESVQFTDAFDYTLQSSTSRGRMGHLLLLLPDKKFDQSFKTCQRFIDHHVAEALAKGREKERSYLFLNEMINSGASPSMLRDQLLAMILGGRDTSASTMSSLFWMLARRPDVVAKMRAEIKDLDNKKPTWEELKNMKYLNNVLKEALRLWSPVATNMRTAVKDVALPKGGGPDGQSPLFVPKGTSCRYSLHSMHRRKDLFGEDALEFRPERWESHRPGWEYLPFSGGPRICIGQQFALTQMSYLIARVFQLFDKIEARDDRVMKHAIGTTLSLPNNCWISLTPA